MTPLNSNWVHLRLTQHMCKGLRDQCPPFQPVKPLIILITNVHERREYFQETEDSLMLCQRLCSVGYV